MAREFDTQLRFGVKDSATPGIRRLSAEFRRLSQARETLGLRGERHLQREIQRTQAAYQRLAHSGTLSANEQVRAYDKMQASIVRVRQEMTVTERQQRSWLKGGAPSAAVWSPVPRRCVSPCIARWITMPTCGRWPIQPTAIITWPCARPG